MQSLRDTLNVIESKILPINQVDHRFRLEHLTFGLDGISIQARLLTSNEEDYSIQGIFSYSQKVFTDWIMVDPYGAEFQVVGIVSKTLYYFARRSTITIMEALGYDVAE